jgi:nucleoside 2-deoxyribosyltransferase
MIANMTPFRGTGADPGTAYEMGFGCALGLTVFAYTNLDRTFLQRVVADPSLCASQDTSNRWRDAANMTIENFGLMDNLMLEGGIRASGGELVVATAPDTERFTSLVAFEECVRRVSQVAFPGHYPGSAG